MNTIRKFHDFMDKLEEAKITNDHPDVKKFIDESKEKFILAMDDDLNISGALAAIFDFMKEINKIMSLISFQDAEKIKTAMMGFDSIIGVMKKEKLHIPEEVELLALKREEARKNKNFKLSDELRDKIKTLGFILEDSKEGARIKKL
jgi:cysteinyl-tRNA synthetase